MGVKILIADDESDIVSMLDSFFESKGFRVLTAFNGAETLKQVEKQPDIRSLQAYPRSRILSDPFSDCPN